MQPSETGSNGWLSGEDGTFQMAILGTLPTTPPRDLGAGKGAKAGTGDHSIILPPLEPALRPALIGPPLPTPHSTNHQRPLFPVYAP